MTCQDCSREFKCSRDLGVHRKRKHGISGLDRSKKGHRERMRRQRAGGAASGERLTCQECGETDFASKTGLAWHRSKLHGVKGDLHCPECGMRRFKDKAGLGVHRRSKHGVIGNQMSMSSTLHIDPNAPMRALFSPKGKQQNFDSTGIIEILALCRRRGSAA